MTHLMWKVCPLARRIVRRDAGHRASDATTSKGQRFRTGGRLCLNFGRCCDHLVVPGTTSMAAPSRRSGKTGQMSHS